MKFIVKLLVFNAISNEKNIIKFLNSTWFHQIWKVNVFLKDDKIILGKEYLVYSHIYVNIIKYFNTYIFFEKLKLY